MTPAPTNTAAGSSNAHYIHRVARRLEHAVNAAFTFAAVFAFGSAFAQSVPPAPIDPLSVASKAPGELLKKFEMPRFGQWDTLSGWSSTDLGTVQHPPRSDCIDWEGQKSSPAPTTAPANGLQCTTTVLVDLPLRAQFESYCLHPDGKSNSKILSDWARVGDRYTLNATATHQYFNPAITRVVQLQAVKQWQPTCSVAAPKPSPLPALSPEACQRALQQLEASLLKQGPNAQGEALLRGALAQRGCVAKN